MSARLDGQARVMVLDTGANITSISTATARELGIASAAPMQINDHIPAGLGVIRSLSIGLAEHQNVRVAIVDLPNARDSAVRFDGVLGLDVLARHDVVLDFRKRTLALYPSGAIMEHDLMPAMTRVALQHNADGLVLLDVGIRGRAPIRAVLDLGAPITVINRAAADQLGLTRPMVRAPAMTVGDVQLARRPMLVRDLPVFARAGLADRPAILLGSDVFANRSLVIGYRDRVAMVSR